MRALVQRVSQACVRVGDEVVGEIGPGLLVLVGVTHGDDRTIARRLAEKVGNLRVFDDVSGVMNRSLLETGGKALVVSQFTLYGDTRKGRRPSWGAAAAPEVAEPLVAEVADGFRAMGIEVATGRFRADMAVSLVNDGPVTVMVEMEPQASAGVANGPTGGGGGT